MDPWVRKTSWRREWQPTPVFLLGESHGQRSLQATVHRVTKSQTQLSDTHTHTHTHTLLFTSTEDVGGEEKWEQIAGGLDGLFLL